MSRVTFDTSVFVSYPREKFPAGFVFSAPVILEIIASANDDTEQRRWEATLLAAAGQGKLIVPAPSDWLMASKILYWLKQNRKKGAGGKTPPLKPGVSQRMALDALIAASARSTDTAVVTVNYSDFKAIQYYCDDLKVIRASSFFKL